MTDYKAEGGATRDELMQRVALMETMIAEGRRTTTRFGWVFVMWGLLYFAAMGWVVFLPMANLAWPVCVAAGIAGGILVRSRQKRAGEAESARSRSIEAVWQVMGGAITLFAIAAVVSHHADGPAYEAAIFFLIGLAHGTSARILRWRAQGLAAAVWFGGGTAIFFFTAPMEVLGIFLAASFFGMVLFGLYAMMLERRGAGGLVQTHA